MDNSRTPLNTSVLSRVRAFEHGGTLPGECGSRPVETSLQSRRRSSRRRAPAALATTVPVATAPPTTDPTCRGGEGAAEDREQLKKTDTGTAFSDDISTECNTSASEHSCQTRGTPMQSPRTSYFQPKNIVMDAQVHVERLHGQGPLPPLVRFHPEQSLAFSGEATTGGFQREPATRFDFRSEIRSLQDRVERTESLLRTASGQHDGSQSTINVQVVVGCGSRGFRSRLCGLTCSVAQSVGQSAFQIAGNEKVRASAGGAVIGATTMGTLGATSGVIVGSTCGAVVGIVPAIFTFGLSIPVGAAIVGCAGLCAGGAIGTTAGAVGGSVAGLFRAGSHGELNPEEEGVCEEGTKSDPIVDKVHMCRTGQVRPRSAKA
uniref:Uncharacterized protein n=1 Tax=Noctiluca scintillans TaxID=2966 RepID=A0A7S1FER5_NOCSC